MDELRLRIRSILGVEIVSCGVLDEKDQRSDVWDRRKEP